MKTVALSRDTLAHLLNGVAPSWQHAAQFYLSLHDRDPRGGGQGTGELAYDGYIRPRMPRDGTAWDVAGDHATNTGIVRFGTLKSGQVKPRWVGLGTDSQGGGRLLRVAKLADDLTFDANEAPQFDPGELEFSEA